MNVLKRSDQRLILNLMCRSNGISDIVDITGHSPNTVRNYLARFGEALAAAHDRLVRGIQPSRLEIDEIWAFIHARWPRRVSTGPRKRAAPKDFGEYYTWTALDPVSKLFIAYHTGNRGEATGAEFFADLCTRVIGRPLISTDGFQAYGNLIQRSFGADMDHVIMEKQFKGFYNPRTGDQKNYLVGLKKVPQNQSKVDVTLASTSLVERLNGTIRASISRFTRRSYKFSKKLENHIHAFAIFVMYYNFAKAHSGLPKGEQHLTPAIKAGLTTKVWDYDDLLDEVDRYWEQKALAPVYPALPKPQYTPLKAGEWSDRPYFVSYSRLHRTAKVHAANCRDCRRAGAGRKEGLRANQWYAFQTEEGARKCAEVLAPLDFSVCSICILGHYPGSMVTGRGPDGRKTVN